MKICIFQRYKYDDMFTPAPQKILIVDDSVASIKVLKENLKEYDCLTANDGKTALEIATGQDEPDLILLDVIMENMDGFEVCSKLKSDFKTREIPVIFITAQKEPEYLVKGFEAGAVDFITKPFNIDELKIRVSTQLKFKKMKDDSARYLKSIEEIYDTVIDGMYYAQRIQNATLPHNQYLDSILDEYFVLYRPRDIVSGDFYMVNQINGKLLLVAADCTGHGVPGALMSMMSMAFIKEIINIHLKVKAAKA
jgi:CheY-like chemotaxis protein